MAVKPRLGFWQIWNMSFGFLGIQFGFALQNANVSRIFETLGADIEMIPILWVAAPVTGLLVQPIVGHLSDKTWNRFGRRRPFFMIGAVLASLALFVMPNSPYLWVAAGMLWVMDASINISMEPFRAFVGDMLPNEQRTMGFAMQSFFIGIGAVVASALPWMLTNWFSISNVAPEGTIPDSVKFSFYIGGVVFFLAVMYTVITTKEYSPEELEAFEAAEQARTSKPEKPELNPIRKAPAYSVNGSIWLISGFAFAFVVLGMQLEKELLVLGFGAAFFGAIQLIVGRLKKKGRENGLVEVIDDLFFMPKTMRQLAIVQFFSWFALFAMWIYTTAGITSHTYDMKVGPEILEDLQYAALELGINESQTGRYQSMQSDLQQLSDRMANSAMEVTVGIRFVKYFLEGDRINYLQKPTVARLQTIDRSYNTGADWVGVLFAAYNGFAALLAFLLPLLAKLTNRRITHLIALTCGGLGLISMYFFSNPNWFLISMIGVGFAWASILSVPYAILTGSLPAHKMGVYMGIFNFFIVIPQILAASLLGFFVKNIFDGAPIYALILGGCSLILSGLLTLRVQDKDA
jgi:maltose/moltooligosaccharide transporter